MDTKHIRYETGLIEYDERLKTYAYTNNLLAFVKSYNLESNTFDIIYVSDDADLTYSTIYSINPIVKLTDGRLMPLISPNVLKGVYKYRHYHGAYRDHRTLPTVYEILNGTMSTTPVSKIKKSYEYGLHSVNKGTLKAYKNYQDLFAKINEKPLYYDHISDFFKPFTYGLEFETISGMIPKDDLIPCGLVPLRDGSISGIEYVTLPLGAEDFPLIDKAVGCLDKYTKTDHSCALHLHIGGIERSEKYLSALFMLLCLVESEMMEYFPIYKSRVVDFKSKCHSAPIPTYLKMRVAAADNPRDKFTAIFNYLADNKANYRDIGNIDNIGTHPSDPGNSAKWWIEARHHWFNMIPIIFGNKQTVEFRMHTATHNREKIFNFMFIAVGLIRYAQDNMDGILSGKISKVTISYICQYGIKKHLGSSPKRDALINNLRMYLSNRRDYERDNLSNGKVCRDESDFIMFSSKYNYPVIGLKRALRRPKIGSDNEYTDSDAVMNVTENIWYWLHEEMDYSKIGMSKAKYAHVSRRLINSRCDSPTSTNPFSHSASKLDFNGVRKMMWDMYDGDILFDQ